MEGRHPRWTSPPPGSPPVRPHARAPRASPPTGRPRESPSRRPSAATITLETRNGEKRRTTVGRPQLSHSPPAPPGAILIIGKRRISITAGIWGTPVRHNNTEPSVHVCAALLGRCGSNFEFSKPLAASPASPNPPTAAARRVRSCTTSRAPRGLLLPPTTRHYATVDNARSCSPTSHPELPCRARSWPAR